MAINLEMPAFPADGMISQNPQWLAFACGFIAAGRVEIMDLDQTGIDFVNYVKFMGLSLNAPYLDKMFVTFLLHQAERWNQDRQVNQKRDRQLANQMDIEDFL